MVTIPYSPGLFLTSPPEGREGREGRSEEEKKKAEESVVLVIFESGGEKL